MYKSKDTRTLFWNLVTGERKGEFQNQVAGEFSPDGKRILTFGARPDKLGWFDAAVWDVATGRELVKARLDDASCPRETNGLGDALHFSPDGANFAYIKNGAYLLTNPSEGVLYDATDGREIGRSPRKNGKYYYTTGGHRYTSNGMLLSLETDNVILTDLKASRIQSIPHGLKAPGFAVWTHDGKKVAVLPGYGGDIKIWDVESRKTTVGAKSHPKQGPGDKAIVSPDNKRLAIESGSNAEDNPDLRLYDMNTGKEIEQIKLAEWGHVIGFSPDSKTILVGGREFVIYDSESGKKIRSFKLLDDVSFSHDWNR